MQITDLSTIRLFRGAGVAAVVLLASGQGWCRERTAGMLDTAREELRAAKVSDKDITLRLKIVENAATVKAYYPHAGGSRPEYRNPDYWTTNDDGSYIPRGRPTKAIRDLWRTESGIRCAKLAALVMLKGAIDVADDTRIAELDEMLKGKVIPNDLPRSGVGSLFEKPHPRKGAVFRTDELLPGDQVWFENPYFELLSRSLQRKYIGQEGHHVFYIGGGKVMDMYSRSPLPIEDFRKTFLGWSSVKIAAKQENRDAKAADFQIKSVRRVILKRS
jgi:hypothetical protein